MFETSLFAGFFFCIRNNGNVGSRKPSPVYLGNRKDFFCALYHVEKWIVKSRLWGRFGRTCVRMSMKKLSLLLLAVLAVMSFGRVGPVSQYGQLQAGKVGNGPGRIYGSCKGVTSGNEVVVQGMSLFWSISSDVGSPFWTSEIVTGLVQKQNIQVIRAPMGVDESWGSGNYFSNESHYQGLMNTVVQAAIDNDIYVIIDYHSHKANENTGNAKKFFGYMASTWGKYDNVIFEIFNEPTSQSWGTIKQYAEAVIDTIRMYSDNLIVVGNRSYDQYPNEAASNPINDKNVAYTFHFYAGIDEAGQHNIDREGANAVSAMNSGLSVFVTEWGNSGPGGNGTMYSNRSSDWYKWMRDNKLSGANWSVSNKNEVASYFSGSAWNYSTSGKWVNDSIFAFLPKSYAACSTSPTSSSSIASSSSSLPAGYTDYIDDLEDGDGFAFTGGEWYAYTDKGDKGASTISNGPGRNDGYNVVISGSTAGNSTKYVAGVTGVKLSQGDNLYDPYVALGVALNESQTAYDLSACNEISYKYKGAAHNFKAEDTDVTDYGYHQITKAASGSWTTVTIPWNMLSQEAWAKPVTLSKKRIAKFTWEIKGTRPAYDYLYIDDVRCSGLAFKPVPSPALSSSSVMSSSSIASSSSMSSSSSKVQMVLQLTSGKADQTVTAGYSIESIVYGIKNVTNISVAGLPAGLNGVVSKSNTTFTIWGTVADSLSDKEYSYTVTAVGADSTATATGKITVKHKPVTTTVSVTNNSTQTVTAGDSIKPIVLSYANMDSAKVTGIPQGTFSMLQDKSAKTLTIAGAVDEGLSDKEYTATVTVYGPDNNATASAKITVKHKPLVTLIELVSGNSTQTVSAGNAIEPIVYRYENMKQITLSGIPAGLKGTKDDNAKTYTISGIVADSLTDYVYDYTIAVTGIDNNTSATGKITVKQSSSSVASSSSEESSSSVESSSSIEPPSSSSEESSSSEVPSSSSEKLSSSSEESSSSSEASSSSVAPSSSSIESSSSEASSSSETSSSSAEASSSSEAPSSSSVESSSSDANQVVVTGSLKQTVALGAQFETITFSNVQTFNRDTWNIWFLDFKRAGDVVTLEGSVHVGFPVGTAVETVTVNGQKYEITFAVVKAESSSSVASSSSFAPSSSSEPAASSSSEASSSSVAPESSSSVEPESSSSESPTLTVSRVSSPLSVNVAGRTLHVAGASDMSVEVFDMQGRPLMGLSHVKDSVGLEQLHQGSYIVRLSAGSNSLVRRIVVK